MSFTEYFDFAVPLRAAFGLTPLQGELSAARLHETKGRQMFVYPFTTRHDVTHVTAMNKVVHVRLKKAQVDKTGWGKRPISHFHSLPEGAGAFDSAVERVAFDGFEAGLQDRLAKGLGGDFLMRVAAADFGDVVPDHGAIHVIDAKVERGLTKGQRLHDPERFHMSENPSPPKPLTPGRLESNFLSVQGRPGGTC